MLPPPAPQLIESFFLVRSTHQCFAYKDRIRIILIQSRDIFRVSDSAFRHIYNIIRNEFSESCARVYINLKSFKVTVVHTYYSRTGCYCPSYFFLGVCFNECR